MKTVHDTRTKSFNIEKAYHDNKYIVSYKSIYQPFYSVNAGYYAQEVYHKNTIEKQDRFTMPGRYFHMTGDSVNRLLGFNHFNNL